MSQEKKTCGRCSGNGQIPCPGCQGTGNARIDERSTETKIVSCSSCRGSGRVPCGICGGSGKN